MYRVKVAETYNYTAGSTQHKVAPFVDALFIAACAGLFELILFYFYMVRA